MPTKPKRSAIRARLGATLRRERAKRGWTQIKASEAAGLDPRHWRKLEHGEVNFTVRTIERLCTALELDVLELFDPI